MKNPEHRNPSRGSDFDLDALLHPAQAFDHPRRVANDPDLTLNEKRAILASWASDACAVEAAPTLRYAPGGRGVASVDEILEALRALDVAAADAAQRTSWLRRQERRRALEGFRLRRRRDQAGPNSSPARQ